LPSAAQLAEPVGRKTFAVKPASGSTVAARCPSGRIAKLNKKWLESAEAPGQNQTEEMPSPKSHKIPAGQGNQRVVPGICLLLVVAVFLVFGQTLRFGFVNYDDSTYLLGDSPVKAGLTPGNIGWAFTTYNSANWHPLTWISYMLDSQLFGLNPRAYHLTNVLLHAANAVLLFLILRHLTAFRSDRNRGTVTRPAGPGAGKSAGKSAASADTLWPAAFVAAVFAIHPLRAESVAWVSERKDVLSGLFFLLTLWAYMSYVSHQAGRAVWRYMLCLLFFALGLMSKPMLVTLPFVLLLLDYWPLGRFAVPSPGGTAQASTRSAARLIFEKLPLLLLAAASSVITFMAQKGSGAVATLENLSLPSRLANGLVSYVAYIFQMLWPAHLAVYYPHPAREPVEEAAVAGMLLLLVTAGVVVYARRFPYLPVGWLWYLGMLTPVIGIIQVGTQTRADRYTYLPQIGLCLLVAWGLRDLTVAWRYRRRVLGAGALVWIAALMVCAGRQTSYWRDSELLWSHTLAGNPDNAVARRNLGDVLVLQGQPAAAIEQFEQAIRIKPGDAEAHYNLAAVLAAQGRETEAAEHYRKAIQFNPGHAEACNNLGSLLAKQGQLDEAINQFQQAVRAKPDYPEARYNLGIAFASQGRLDDAALQFQKVIQLRPDDVAAHLNLGNILAAKGRLAEAIGHYRRALVLANNRHDSVLTGIIQTRLQICQTNASHLEKP
jgi:protein O-mannosyl-transferase